MKVNPAKVYLFGALAVLALLPVFREPVVRVERGTLIDAFLRNTVYERNYIFDGMLRFRDLHLVFPLDESIARTRPFHMKIRIREQPKIDRIELHFASSASGQYYFLHSYTDPDSSGVYLGRNFRSTKLLDLPNLKSGNEAVFEVFCDGREMTLIANDRRGTVRLAEEIDRMLLEVLGGFAEGALLIDSIEINRFSQSPGGDRVLTPVKRWDFDSPPVLLDLPFRAGLTQESLLSIMASFVLLALAAFLIDDLLARRLLSFLGPGLDLRGRCFLLIPLQMTILFVLRAAFALPLTALLLVSVPVLLVKSALLFGSRFEKAGLDPGFYGRLLQTAAGVFVYAVFLALFRDRMIAEFRVPADILYGFASIPMVMFLVTAYLSPNYPVSAFTLTLIQAAGFFLFRRFCYFPNLSPYLVLTLLPWLCWTVVFILRQRRFGRLYKGVAALMLPAALLGSAEVALRLNRLASVRLDSRFIVEEFCWDFEERTDIFGKMARTDKTYIRNRWYSSKKPPGVFRIGCLGSSSTWGAGTRAGDVHYPGFLQDYLDRHSSTPVEVINAGIVPGASFTMLKIYAADVLAKLDLDLLIVYFGANMDIDGLEEYYTTVKELVRKYPHIDSNYEVWAARKLVFPTRRLLDGFVALAETRLFTGIVLVLERLDPLFKISRNDGVTMVKRSIIEPRAEQIVNAFIGGGTKVLFVPEITLTDVSTDGSRHEYYRIFEDVSRRYSGRGVYMLDLLDYFKKEFREIDPHLETSGILVDEMHMTYYGYRLLGERIASHLLEARHIPRQTAEPAAAPPE